MGSLIFFYLSFCLKFYVVLSHGYLKDPPSRSSMWRLPQFNTLPKNYNDNQLYCGGKQHQWETNGGKCGICGDPYDSENRENEAGGKYASSIISKCYNQFQSTITVTVTITANHKGYFEFRLCENNDPSVRVTQSCLDEHLLTLADGSGTRYYIADDIRNYTVNLNLPSIKCSQCVLQWKYNTGNSWGCNSSHCGMGLGAQEQFYGCSDIAIDKNCETFDLYQFKKSSTTQSTTTKQLSVHTTSKDGSSTTQSSSISLTSSSTAHPTTTPISKSSIISLTSSSKPSTSLPVSSTNSAILSSSSSVSPTSSSISSTSSSMSSTSLPVSSTPLATLSKSSPFSSSSSSISSKSSPVSSTSVLTKSSSKPSVSSSTSTQSTSTLKTYTKCVAKMEYSDIEAVEVSCNVSCAKGYCLVYYCNCDNNHPSSTPATTVQQTTTLKKLLMSSSLSSSSSSSSSTTSATNPTKSVSPTTTTTVPTTSTTTASSTSNSCANVRVTDIYKDTPGMLDWCIVSCKNGQCPASHCICS